jgi:5-enolpyruvylshikimate-3-phosphate synthase
LLLSEDVIATINAVKKLGVKVKLNKIIALLLVLDQVATNIKKI